MSLISTIGVASPDMAYDYYASLSSNINAYVEPGFDVAVRGDYITNISPVNGKSIYGRLIPIPFVTYPQDNWYYDWTALIYNDAHYIFGVRQYSSSSIPPTVYFQDYNTTPLEYLPLPTGAVGVKWIFDSTKTVNDISGNRVNLPLISTSSPSASILGRSETWLGQAIDHAKGLYNIQYAATTGSVLNFTDTFTCEAWVTGVDNLATQDDVGIRIRRETNGSGSIGGNLTHDGYMFSILPYGPVMSLSVYKSGALSITSTSLATIVSEQPSRYHYFAVTYNLGNVVFYVDGEVRAQGTSLPSPIPALSASTFTSVEINSTPSTANPYILGVDEIVLSSVAVSPEEIRARFEASKPRLTRLSVPAYGTQLYHQPRWKVWASGSTEFELHHFSIRGLDYAQQYIFDRKSAAVLEFPLFVAPSGSI